MLGLFVDIESTGLNPREHEPIEIAIAIADLTHGVLIESYTSVLFIGRQQWERSDPRSIAINGFTWEMLQSGKTKQQVAAEVIALLGRHGVVRGKALFICQNPTFDRAFFSTIIDVYTQDQCGWPYHWLDLASMYWIERVKEWHRCHELIPDNFSVSKDDIAAYYKLPPEDHPHRAYNGVEHLLSCYEAVTGQAIMRPVSKVKQ